MLAYVFQEVKKNYQSGGWSIHHEQRLQFQKTMDDSQETITLHVAKPSSEHEKWVVDPVNTPTVRKSSPQTYRRLILPFIPCLFAADFKE